MLQTWSNCSPGASAGTPAGAHTNTTATMASVRIILENRRKLDFLVSDPPMGWSLAEFSLSELPMSVPYRHKKQGEFCFFLARNTVLVLNECLCKNYIGIY